jgi:uncharacterized membrane protein
MVADPPPPYTEDRVTTQLYAWIARILAVGFWLSIGIIVVGVSLALLSGDGISEETLSVGDILPAVLDAEADGLIGLGILLLLLTPLSYVVAALVIFARQRDRLFVGVCLMLILLIAASIGLAVF